MPILFITLYFIYDILTKETKDKARPYHNARIFVILCYNQDAIPVFLFDRCQPASCSLNKKLMNKKVIPQSIPFKKKGRYGVLSGGF